MTRDILAFAKRNWRIFLVVFTLGLMAHFSLYAHGLTNPDGLWSDGGYQTFMARDWDYSLGRWGWFFLTKIRGGVGVPGIMAPLVLGGFTLAALFGAESVGIVNNKIKAACAGIIVCSPLVACSLSYYPFADVYSIAFLCSTAAIWLMNNADSGERSPLPAHIIAGIAVCFAVSLYQTTVGVSLALALGAFSIGLKDRNLSIRKQLKRLFSKLLVIFLGCAVYLVITKIVLVIANVEMADYKGASGISLSNALVSLPISIPFAWNQFVETLFGHSVFGNHYLARWICLVIIVLGLAGIILSSYSSKKITGVLFALLSTAALPFFAMIICIIAPSSGAVTPLMVGGCLATILIFISGTVLFTDMLSGLAKALPNKGIIRLAMVSIPFVLAAALTWSYTLQINLDSSVQQLIDNQATQLANRVLYDIEHSPDYSRESSVAIIGIPTDESYPWPYDINLASPYVNWGLFWRSWGGENACWDRLLKVRLGVVLNIVSADDAKQLASTEQFRSMPNYPSSDSVQTINGVIIVKVSKADNLT